MIKSFSICVMGVLLAEAALAGEEVSRIAFGSCCKESRAAPIFERVKAFGPEVWIWMGDNVYGDTTDMAVLRKKYATQRARPGYAALREGCEVIGTWDDHDFGEDNVGKEYAKRAESQEVFLDFLEVEKDDPRRKQEGVYGSHEFGKGDRAVKVILLDTRYHRDAPGKKGDVLGKAQWKWLEEELKGSKAAVHLLVTSIQLIPSEHRYEKWANFPKAKARLLALLSGDGVPPVTVLSGDRHLGEISVEKEEVSYPLYEITSSSLNVPIKGREDEVNTRRIGENYDGANFGTLEIDWETMPATLRFAVRDTEGKAVRAIEVVQGR